MDNKFLKYFLLFLAGFILLVSGLAIYDNLTKVKVLEEEHLADVTFDENKKNIYIFWGNGCAHCEDLKAFLEANTELWESDYQIFSFETWKDEENQNLMDDLMEFLGRENEGTPTVIIGDEVLVGYGDNMQDTYKNALESQKENDYDAIREYQSEQQQ
ncbi:TPA: hypothetical protein IAB29_00275 [Candidatus Ventrenecus stercoripullorum]|nr:hypothetical protein [Candidatus Ventrenecus stercoripullorum]